MNIESEVKQCPFCGLIVCTHCHQCDKKGTKPEDFIIHESKEDDD